MPLASMSKVTSIWGTPRGAGGIPVSWNCPRSLLSFAISLSPWCTFNSTWVWPSAAEENTGDISSQDSALNGGSHGHGFVRVDRLAWGAAEDLLASVLHLRHPAHSSDEDNFANVRLGHLGILHSLQAWLHSLLDEVANNLFKLGPRQLQVHVLGACGVHGKVGQVDVGLCAA